ncbi:hypothetical protein [Rhodopseudomonas palustris]|uniref:Uncharacterized protein n=1 Tax=Rhodopseudomonas palustris TaxID=1076 RepID=A0A418V463_RHOPL|nr:hypothetical protein [Rhodopseudomonas palustris]RJF70898.1 hypothetical protein D4Q52_14815 [Rhodopseudomonas palustris]
MTTPASQLVRPSIADQAAAIDAIEVASRIVAHGARAAIGASTVEIIALASATIHLAKLADLTFAMMISADAMRAEREPARRLGLGRVLARQIADLGVALEALGYVTPLAQPTEQENHHGQG